MATEQALRTVTLLAAADLSTKTYYGIKIDTNGAAALATEGSTAIGILQDAPGAAGRACVVAVDGVSKVVCGASLNPGDRFSFDSNGKAVSVGSDDDFSMGVMIDSGSSGKISKCLLQPLGRDQR